MSDLQWKNQILEKTLELGFSFAGLCQAIIPKSDKENFQKWVELGFQGSMDWFPRQKAIREDFQNLGFRVETVLVLGLVYRSLEAEEICSKSKAKVSKYALGEDYHIVLREKAKPLLAWLKSNFPNFQFRQGVDSLPISEKVLAREAGLGWISKNTNLINLKKGSFFFLSCILTDIPWLEAWAERMETDHCGNCTACIEACPTGALQPYKIDARKCLSYQTIESKSFSIVDHSSSKGWVYGCDICQDICPWNKNVANRNSVLTSENKFKPFALWHQTNWDQAKDWDQKRFDFDFEKSPILRIGLEKWKSNLA